MSSERWNPPPAYFLYLLQSASAPAQREDGLRRYGVDAGFSLLLKNIIQPLRLHYISRINIPDMKIGSKIRLLACLLLSCVMLSACDDVIYDDEGDCVVHYKVRFKYDYNMKFADAFAQEVDAVTLYLVDENDAIVWQKTESGPRLSEEGYAMDVDVAPGRYSLMAWCGSEAPTTFRIGAGSTCRDLKADFFTEDGADGSSYIDKKLDRLFYGYVADVDFPAADEGTFVYTVPLTKDTNHFVITLQQLSGEPIDKDIVEFEIIDDNAHLDWNNEPITGKPVTYRQWYKENVNADISTKSVRAADNGTFAGVIAELTTSRLMMSNSSNARLRVFRTDTGETIASIRLIDALLLVMGYDNSKKLTKQQYLDYRDEYDLTFFLDENHRWLSGLIEILSWRVVYQEREID